MQPPYATTQHVHEMVIAMDGTTKCTSCKGEGTMTGGHKCTSCGGTGVKTKPAY